MIIMMLMLAGILLRPARKTERSSSVILLTPGYQPKNVDSLLKLDAGATVTHTPDATAYKDSELLRSYQELTTMGNSITHIIGDGIPGYALDLMGKKQFTFIPSKLPEGVIALDLPPGVVVNHASSINGVFNNAGGVKWLYLNSPGGKEDSLKITEKGKTSFSLNFSPTESGNVIYTISVKDSVQTNIHGNIPIAIQPERPLRVLCLQGYPTFETQYLKNFLAHKRHSLLLRFQLSKNNFRYESANRTASRISRLTKEVLNEFDLLIADQESLDNLTATEKALITESIRSGLGVLSILNKEINTTSKPTLLPVPLTPIKADTTTVRLGSKSYTLPALAVRPVQSPTVQSVIENKSGVLSGYTFEGAGRIGFQLLQGTYQVTLSGDSTGYSALWTPLLERLARVKNQYSVTKVVSPFPLYSDEPVDIDIISSSKIPTLYADSTKISLQEDVLIDDVWHTTIWADAPGWHKIQVNLDDITSLYVSNNDEWKSLSIARQQNYLMNAASSKKNPVNEKMIDERELPMVWFFLVFLVAAGFIWLGPKV